MSGTNRKDAAGRSELSKGNANETYMCQQELDGDINFATDAWTSPNQKAYVAVSAHFHHEGKLVALLLDIVEVATSHNGENLAHAFAGIIDAFGVGEKVSYSSKYNGIKLTVLQFFSLGGDSASANDAMVDELANIMETFPGQKVRVRCFLHILNLVVKTILRQFDIPKNLKKDIIAEAMQELEALPDNIEDGEGDDDDDEGENKGLPDGEDEDNVEGWEDEREGMTEEKISELDERVQPVQRLLLKVGGHVICLLIGLTLILGLYLLPISLVFPTALVSTAHACFHRDTLFSTSPFPR